MVIRQQQRQQQDLRALLTVSSRYNAKSPHATHLLLSVALRGISERGRLLVAVERNVGWLAAKKNLLECPPASGRDFLFRFLFNSLLLSTSDANRRTLFAQRALRNES